MNTATIYVILVILVLLALFFIIPQFMTRRAVLKLIKTFREHNAVGINNAKTLEELGMRFPSFFQKMVMPRDYRPKAIQLLISAKVIGYTEDQKLYLIEENLVLGSKYNR
ncbi:hypothetical protein ACFLXC_01325 [Chloroflexota bacterium]